MNESLIYGRGDSSSTLMLCRCSGSRPVIIEIDALVISLYSW